MNFERGERVVYYPAKHPHGKMDAVFLSCGKTRSRIRVRRDGEDAVILVGNESLEKWKPMADPVLLRAFEFAPGLKG